MKQLPLSALPPPRHVTNNTTFYEDKVAQYSCIPQVAHYIWCCAPHVLEQRAETQPMGRLHVHIVLYLFRLSLCGPLAHVAASPRSHLHCASQSHSYTDNREHVNLLQSWNQGGHDWCHHETDPDTSQSGSTLTHGRDTCWRTAYSVGNVWSRFLLHSFSLRVNFNLATFSDYVLRLNLSRKLLFPPYVLWLDKPPS